MSWRGKIIGGSLGSFFGPWGAVAGAAMGHAFIDRKERDNIRQSSARLTAITAAALTTLARTSGSYTPNHDRVIRSIMGELNQQLGNHLTQLDINYLIDDATRLPDGIIRLAGMARTNQHLGGAALTWLWRVAVSNGNPTTRTISQITAFATNCGLPPHYVTAMGHFYARLDTTPGQTQNHQEACEILGVPHGASPDEIKSAYRSLSLRYHPDRHANLDPDIRALTAEKFTQINTAYNTLNHTTSPITSLWVLRADNHTLIPATDSANQTLACFHCHRPARVVELPALTNARCSACQTLLALDHSLATTL